MNKHELLDTLVKEQEERIKGLRTMYENYKAGADLDEEDIRDLDDFSHQDEWEQASSALMRRIQEAEDSLKSLKKMPIIHSKKVEKGAVVEVNKILYFVGYPLPKTFYHNSTVFGISEEAPIFLAMKDLQEGDTYELNHQTFTIHKIY